MTAPFPLNDGREPHYLLSAWCDGTLSRDQQQRLEGWLRSSDAAVDEAVDYLDLHASLWVCPSRRSGVRGPHPGPTSRRSRIAPLLVRFVAAAVIVLGMIATISLLVTHAWNRPPALVATLTDTDHARFDSLEFRPGDRIPAGFLRLASGRATLTFDSGAVVTLTGPCEFGLNSPMRGLLRRGRLAAYCPPSAHGFTVGGPGCAVIDLGTRFRMEVDAAGQTHVTVERGKVRLTSAGRVVALHAHQQARVVAEGKVAVAFAGPIPLGALFDDAPGTPLAQAVASDEVGAVAHTGGLGVERVETSRGSNIAEIAPGVSFDFGPLDWKYLSSSHRQPTNRAWSNVPGQKGLSTTGVPRRSGTKSEPGIGVHANLLITFDLDAIRAAGDIGRDAAMRFVSDRAGLDDSAAPGSAPMHLLALVSDGRRVLAAYVEGRAVRCVRSGVNWGLPNRLPPPITRTGHFARFDVPLSPAARYLTLVSVAAGPNTNNTHGVFAAARLELQPSSTFKGEEQ